MINVLLAHGSADARHGDQVRRLAGRVAKILGEDVHVSFLSDGKLPAGARLLPLLLGGGEHARLDAPKLAQTSSAELLPALASHADKLAAMAMDLATRQTRRVNVLFVLYRFSGFEKLTAALYGQAGRCAKMALASMHGEPSPEAVLRHWRDEGVETITIQPVLLFDGQTCDKLRMAAGSVEGVQLDFMPLLAQHESMPAFIADCLRGSA